MILNFSWRCGRNHRLQGKGHATPSVQKSYPGWRRFCPGVAFKNGSHTYTTSVVTCQIQYVFSFLKLERLQSRYTLDPEDSCLVFYSSRKALGVCNNLCFHISALKYLCDDMVRVDISDEGVIIRFAPDEPGARRLDSMAERQCKRHILAHPSEQFSLKTDGRFPASVIAVTIDGALLERLPLLQDVRSSTNNVEPAEMELLWGLVSLLILLEGSVGVEEWFGGDPRLLAASLPGSTLLVRVLTFA